MDGKVVLWVDNEQPHNKGSFNSLDEAVEFVRNLYGPACDVGNIAGTIVDDEGQVIAEYAEI